MDRRRNQRPKNDPLDVGKSLRRQIARNRPAAPTEPSEAAPKRGWPAPPSTLRPAAQELWKSIAPQLAELGLVRASDRYSLGRYCETLAHYYEATAVLHAEGEVYESRGKHGTMRRLHPLVGITSRLDARLQTLEDKLGLNPAARSALMAQQGSVSRMGVASSADAPEAGDVLTFFSKTRH